jgi:hypothetical protein
MAAGDLGAVGETCVIQNQRAAFAGNHVFGIVKTENAEVSERTGRLSAIGSHQRLRGIFDHQETMPLG